MSTPPEPEPGYTSAGLDWAARAAALLTAEPAYFAWSAWNPGSALIVATGLIRMPENPEAQHLARTARRLNACAAELAEDPHLTLRLQHPADRAAPDIPAPPDPGTAPLPARWCVRHEWASANPAATCPGCGPDASPAAAARAPGPRPIHPSPSSKENHRDRPEHRP